ncbi:sce7726 family protein [Schinkia azotoformans]|uniref:sce7726 family protein n=1 Tax=Schinkia azotoformans TaxID=1454 RepID=UPI002E1D0D0E|nr:sce7726 family protein [Schinkia azotoformans]
MDRLFLSDKLTNAELTQIARSLNDNYHAFLLDVQVWELIKSVVPSDIYKSEIQPLKKKFVGHKIVNDIVMNYYMGEKKVKYHLAKQFINRPNEVSLFEFNVGSSRLDFARINGHSYAYEIKTELDSLEKLEKQLIDYSRVFEYIHVIVHPKHYNKVYDLVPEHCGIATYNSEKSNFPFSYKKKRLLNPNIEPLTQLQTLTVKEINSILKIFGIEATSLTRKEKEEKLLESISPPKINHLFKEHIKMRFQKRWFHICNHIEEIEPIDLQSFFKSTIDPALIYYKNSSIV